MAHNLFVGGAPRSRHYYGEGMFPSEEVGVYDPMFVDARLCGATCAITRELDWGCAPTSPCQPPGGQGRGSRGLQQYLMEGHQITAEAPNNVLNLIQLPARHLFHGVAYEVSAGGAGFLFNIVLRGAAGTITPSPVVLASVVATNPASGWVAFPGGPILLDHNDMIQMVITGLPTPVAGQCPALCEVHPITSTHVALSAVVTMLYKGDVGTNAVQVPPAPIPVVVTP